MREVGPSSKCNTRLPRLLRSSNSTMNDAIQRSVLRGVHLVLSIPLVGYAYSPFEKLPEYAPVVRYFAVPAIVLSGFWMWKGPALRRLIAKRSTQPGP